MKARSLFVTCHILWGCASSTPPPPTAFVPESKAGVQTLYRNGAAYAAPATISLLAAVTGNGNTINKVQFYNNGTDLLAEDAVPSYSYVWPGVSAGSHSLLARVVYNGSQTVDSTSKSVTVTNRPPVIASFGVLVVASTLVGLGTVGSGTLKILLENADQIALKLGFRLRVRAICSLEVHIQALPDGIGEVVKTTDWREVVTHPEVDIVVELVGGTTVAAEVIDGAIANGKSVVTANKELIALRGAEIWERAIQAGINLAMEASVCGGIPIHAVLREGISGDRVTALYESVWSGAECGRCRLRSVCPDPIGPAAPRTRKGEGIRLGRARRLRRR